MAYTTEYTKTVTTLEGNSLVYNLQEEGGAAAGNTLAITENSYNLEYFFNDRNSQNIGQGFLSKIITLEFFESNEVDDIRVNPEDWRLTITLDGNTIFVGFVDNRSITEYILESYSDIYECTFVSVFSRLKKLSVITEIGSSSNPNHFTDQIAIPDLIGEFVFENYCNLSATTFIGHPWQSNNCVSGGTTRRADPHMRYFQVDPGRVTPEKIAELISYITIAFSMRIGWSHIEGKTLMVQHIEGADGASISGYDCPKVASGFRTASATTVALQTLATDGSDFITDGKDVNSDNPVFPVAFIAVDANHSDVVSNPSNSPYLEDPITLTTIFKDDALCAADPDGITVEGTGGIDSVLGQLDQVDPSALGSLADLNEAFAKRMGTDYLFTEGLKGFRINVNKVLDPMIPITYDSKVYITPEGIINLYEETTDSLLTEIQDNG